MTPPTGPADPTRGLPPMWIEPSAAQRIRRALVQMGRRVAVLDDDPTGSQTVHGVDVVTVAEPQEISAGLPAAGSTAFILTNSRSMPEASAAEVAARVGRTLFALAARLGSDIDVVSRGDSTLRGHLLAEVRALDAARREATGRGYDGVLLVPAYLEAGRFTAGNLHWARTGDQVLPVGQTEFARDATFGFASSDLREYLAEKSGGAIRADQVLAVTLDDIRRGGPHRVAQILTRAAGGAFVVVNAVDRADLDVVALGALDAVAAGRALLYRAGPSFAGALAGIEPRGPLTPADIWPTGRPGRTGLVVVGSHVGRTGRQLTVLREHGGLTEAELDVTAATNPTRRDQHVTEVAQLVTGALGHSDVLLFTSRTLARGGDAAASLDIARSVSTAVTAVVGAAMAARPGWVLAKGGNTAHDVAVHALGIRRATIIGQLLPGQVSVWLPTKAAPHAVGLPYAVFAGNVGGDTALADVVDVLRAARRP